MQISDAIIIGGGLHGLSTAIHLAKAGLNAVVLEKDPPGRHASGVNAGGVRRLGRHLAEGQHLAWDQYPSKANRHPGAGRCPGRYLGIVSP